MGLEERLSTSEEEEEDDDEADWEDWNEAGSINSRAVDVGTDADSERTEAKCLLCSTRRPSAEHAFEHCSQKHGLDFAALRRQSQIGFYDSLRLINYIRSQVAVKTCWNCGAQYDSENSLLEHLNAARHSSLPHSSNGEDTSASWKSDSYLVPSLENDALLYSLDESNDEDPEEFDMIDKNAILSELAGLDSEALAAGQSVDGPLMEIMDGLDNLFVSAAPSNASAQVSSEQSNGTPAAGKMSDKDELLEKRNLLRKNLKVTFGSVAQKEISSVNSKYFSSYGEYGIHREMLGDKERTGAYYKAILKNPTLFEDASVLDIGCGTGILSLFAAKAGASKVIAVDGSEKMVSVARQVARDNGYIRDGADSAITVVGGMIEDLDGKLPLNDHSVDIIVSEWMGYCLLYESMLGSVLHARDRWLKPGGAMLPDVAELHMAGFGKGGTSLPFWEDVYGFNLKHIGEEVVHHAAEFPIIDVMDKKDVITESCLIKKFDLVTMRPEDVDFTTLFELKPKLLDTTNTVTWCYGVVLWFDTGFTERFCKEDPVVLTTSPFAPSTHWSQTLLTFKEPIALSQAADNAVISGELGTEATPALALRGRISIARSFKHRSIDISLETTAVGTNGATRMLPVQIFDI